MQKARRLKASGWDAAAAAAQFLEERLELAIASAFHFSKDSKRATGHGSWGLTFDTGRWQEPATNRIRIEIASEIIWPLLVPVYTTAEKASASTMLATVLCHELAVRTLPWSSAFAI